MNNHQIQSTLFKALREAGSLLKASLSRRGGYETKQSELSLVTQTDREAERIIIGLIRQSFPDHAILAEESLGSGTSPHRWVIDPLDGTTNFAHTYPVCCVSIAYEYEGQVQIGGIFDPFRDELFFASKGGGAFLNEEQIHVSKTPRLTEALLSTGFPYDRKKNIDMYVAPVRDFLMHIHGIRRTGSAALDMCYVASGRFDGYFESKLSPWDIAAAGLIVVEAGGRLSNYAGKPFTLTGSQTVASNGLIHDAMLEVLKPHQHVGLS